MSDYQYIVIAALGLMFGSIFNIRKEVKMIRKLLEILIQK